MVKGAFLLGMISQKKEQNLPRPPLIRVVVRQKMCYGRASHALIDAQLRARYNQSDCDLMSLEVESD